MNFDSLGHRTLWKLHIRGNIRSGIRPQGLRKRKKK